MKPFHWHCDSTAGFSLIEAIIALSITVILTLTVIEFMSTGLRTQTYISTESTEQIDSRRSLNMMMQQLREITDGDDGSYALGIANSYQIMFYSDIDRDSATEQVQYIISGTTLQRIVIHPTDIPPQYLTSNAITTTVASQVTNVQSDTPLFEYYDANNTQLTSPINLKDVTLVKIQLHLASRTTETYVQLRNLKTNL